MGGGGAELALTSSLFGEKESEGVMGGGIGKPPAEFGELFMVFFFF